MEVRKHLKAFCPPVLFDLYRSISGRRGIRFSRIYASWGEALADASGYDASLILNKVIAATNKVVSGEAKFERDSVTFDAPCYPFPLISVLLKAANENDGKLRVLDFGGALGSSYYQCRDFLEGVRNLRWCIVEQPHFADAGNQRFLSDKLLFFKEMEPVWTMHKPNVVLFSGVLQYLPEPYAILKNAIDNLAEYIVVDRTPFIEGSASILSLQKVPHEIVASSYPAWLFSETEFLQFFSRNYSAIASFEAVDGIIGRGRLKAAFKGIVFRKMRSSGSRAA